MEEVEERVDLNGLLLEKDDKRLCRVGKALPAGGDLYYSASDHPCFWEGAVLLYLIHALWNRSRRKEMGDLSVPWDFPETDYRAVCPGKHSGDGGGLCNELYISGSFDPGSGGNWQKI